MNAATKRKTLIQKCHESFIGDEKLSSVIKSKQAAANNPTTILGCWVINHKFNGYKTGEKIGVNGSYDVNIWYSYDNDSKTTVVNKNISYRL